ncbi:MAG TPA: hypothetical protein PK631_01205, partial [Erysipelotrichaceae bacterium]|nr:hypothetical protein [Erysipelotrichaceae bacterium]
MYLTSQKLGGIGLLTWEKFNVNNENKTKSFEQLCRLLFKENFCNGSIVLCSSPNHKGIEADPVKDKDGKLIGFQAKYFENRVNYSQIKRSFLEIAKEYSGELDILYLYSNKDISKNSKSYKECLQIL